MKIEAFIIHLQRAMSRRGQVEKLQRRLPMPSHILDAVDGQSLSAAQIAAVYRRDLHKPHYPFELRTGEIACFLSHRRAWQEIIDWELDAALILEDDVDLVPGVFDTAYGLASSYQWRNPAYIQFGLRPVQQGTAILVHDNDAKIVRPCKVFLGTVGQLVTRQAAEILLRTTKTFDRPIDVLLQMHWLTGVRPVTVTPSGIIDRTQEIGGSTIHSSKTLAKRLEREWGRFIYRWRISKLSRIYNESGKYENLSH